MNRRYRKTFHGLALLGCMLVVFRIGVTFLSSNVEERSRSVKLQDAGVHQRENALRNLLGAGENGISEPTQRASVVRKAVDSTEDPFPDLTENPPPSQSGKDGFSEGINKAKPWLFGITALLCILMMTGAHYCGDYGKATSPTPQSSHKLEVASSVFPLLSSSSSHNSDEKQTPIAQHKVLNKATDMRTQLVHKSGDF